MVNKKYKPLDKITKRQARIKFNQHYNSLHKSEKKRHSSKKQDMESRKKDKFLLRENEPGSARYLHDLGPKTFDFYGVDAFDDDEIFILDNKKYKSKGIRKTKKNVPYTKYFKDTTPDVKKRWEKCQEKGILKKDCKPNRFIKFDEDLKGGKKHEKTSKRKVKKNSKKQVNKSLKKSSNKKQVKKSSNKKQVKKSKKDIKPIMDNVINNNKIETDKKTSNNFNIEEDFINEDNNINNLLDEDLNNKLQNNEEKNKENVDEENKDEENKDEEKNVINELTGGNNEVEDDDVEYDDDKDDDDKDDDEEGGNNEVDDDDDEDGNNEVEDEDDEEDDDDDDLEGDSFYDELFTNNNINKLLND